MVSRMRMPTSVFISTKRVASSRLRTDTCHERGAADHWNHREDDYYSQPGMLFRLMTSEQQKMLFENTARAMERLDSHNQVTRTTRSGQHRRLLQRPDAVLGAPLK